METGKILLIALALFGLLVVSQAVFAEDPVLEPVLIDANLPIEEPIVGEDEDEHGCIGSAGYIWCPELEKCVRPWEEECESWEKEIEENGFPETGGELPVLGAPLACTEDARVCSDGETMVVRDPENDCEFEPCPEELRGCTMEALLCSDGSSVGRNPENNCEFDPCPDVAIDGPVQLNPITAFFNAIISFFAGFFK